jgi:hypothetical protein
MRRYWTNAWKTWQSGISSFPTMTQRRSLSSFEGGRYCSVGLKNAQKTASAASRTFQDLVFEEYQRSNTGLPS